MYVKVRIHFDELAEYYTYFEEIRKKTLFKFVIRKYFNKNMNKMCLLSWLYKQLILFGIFNVGDAVFRGRPAQYYEFPYLAYIAIMGNTGYCGGGILDETHILTAAHCVANYNVTDMTVIIEQEVIGFSESHKWEVANKIIHPDFRPFKRLSDIGYYLRCFIPSLGPPLADELPQNDIAVITLKEPLPLFENVRPLRIPECKGMQLVDECYFAGWGEDDCSDSSIQPDLGWTKMKILSRIECLESHQWHREDTEFCAIDPKKEAFPAMGDSGSPLVCHGYVFGILSSICLNDFTPAHFIDVFSHRKFIKEALMN